MGLQVNSLLPYLDASIGGLKIHLVAQDLPTLEKLPFPFLVLSDSDPFSLLIEARFVTDAGSELKKVFLLVQRDSYSAGKAGLRPITNRDIDQAWQKAYNFYLRSKIPPPPVVLSGQVTEGGTAVPSKPLFYCKKTATYFHPPCPNCGRPLQKCEDDGLLQTAGLHPHTSSLRRYLFCTSCSASGSVSFYVRERVCTDPPTELDREELIRSFGRCRERADPDTRFPCPGCPHHAECYEPGNLATARVAALSFYPFHMLAFEAMSLNAEDFLALLSGATVPDLTAFLRAKGEQGRIGLLQALRERGGPGVRFLFEDDDRWFLEVLYLKLSFLGEVFRTLVSESDILQHPEMSPCMDHLWVKLADHGGLLPFLWNFRIQLIDIGNRTPGTLLFPDRPGSYGLHILGLMWLETLLSNRRQGNVQVHDALRRVAETCPLEDDRFVDRTFRGRSHPAFLPENIFWDPEGKGVADAWNPLWGKALRLGWNLLAGGRRSAEWSAETFQGELESLRREVRDALFPKPSAGVRQAGATQEGETGEPEVSPRAPRHRSDEDEGIRRILEGICSRWKGAGEPQGMEPVEAEDELEKTRILSLAGTKQPPEVRRMEERREEEIFVETVILSSAEPSGRPASPSGPATSCVAEHEGREKRPSVEAEELEKTIFLDPTKPRGKGKDGSKW
jgi:hypothetical protein